MQINGCLWLRVGGYTDEICQNITYANDTFALFWINCVEIWKFFVELFWFILAFFSTKENT